MGIFSGVRKAVNRATKNAGRIVNVAGRNAGRVGTGASKFVINNAVAAGAAPFVVSAGIAGNALGAVSPVIGQATQILRENPELAGLAGGALGLPIFGAGGPAAGGGGFAPAPEPPPQSSGPSRTMIIIAALAGLLAVIWISRKG